MAVGMWMTEKESHVSSCLHCEQMEAEARARNQQANVNANDDRQRMVSHPQFDTNKHTRALEPAHAHGNRWERKYYFGCFYRLSNAQSIDVLYRPAECLCACASVLWSIVKMNFYLLCSIPRAHCPTLPKLGNEVIYNFFILTAFLWSGHRLCSFVPHTSSRLSSSLLLVVWFHIAV